MASATEEGNNWHIRHEFGDCNGQDFKMAMGIAQRDNGDFAVADPVSIRVGVFTTTGIFKTDVKSLEHEDGKLFQPSDVAVTSDGNIVVPDKTALVKVYDADSGNFMFGFTTVPSDGDAEVRTHVCPSAVQVYKDQASSHEQIFVLDILRKLLTCHENDGSFISSFSAGGKANYFSVVDTDRFIMSDYNDYKVRIIDRNGCNIVVIDTPIDGLGRRASPVGSCVDREAGKFYVAMGKRQGHCEIFSYDMNTGKFTGSVATKLRNPFNLIITKEGEVAVADRGTIKVFSKT